MTNSKVVIKHSRFESNSAPNNVADVYSKHGVLFISHSTFKRNSVHYSGGGAFLKKSTVYLENSSFSENSAMYGGAIFVDDHSEITKFDVVFISSSIKTNIIYSDNYSRLDIPSTAFSFSENMSGEAIFVHDHSKMTMFDVVFISNSVKTEIIFCDNYSRLDISSIDFKYNEGVCMEVFDHSQVTIHNSTFSSNLGGVFVFF